MSKEELKTTLRFFALNEKFEYQIKGSTKIRFEAFCKDIGYKFQLHVIGVQEGSCWIVGEFGKDHS